MTSMTRGGGSIGSVGVALDGPGEVVQNDGFETVMIAPFVPVVEGVASGFVNGPEIAFGSLPVAVCEILDGCFIDLHVSIELRGCHRFDHELEPLGDKGHCVAYGLSGPSDAVSALMDVFLSIKRQVIDVFGDDDLGEETGSKEAAFKKFLGERGDDGRKRQ